MTTSNRRPRHGSARTYQNESGQWFGVRYDAPRGVWSGAVLPNVTTRAQARRAMKEAPTA